MAELREIVTPRTESRAEAVKLLEEALEDARAGMVESVAIVVVEPSGKTTTAASQTTHAGAMVGGLAVMQHRIMTEME